MTSNKKRFYDVDYLKWGIIECPLDSSKPYCLNCNKAYLNSIMKPSGLERHFNSEHKRLKDKPLTHFIELKKKFEKRDTFKNYKRCYIENENLLLKTSFVISCSIAKLGKPHTIGEELIKPALSSFCKKVLSINDFKVQNLPLSNDSVRRRIDTMAEDVEDQLVEKLRNCFFFNAAR